MHTLYQGDNVSVMRALIPDESIQLTVTSPPYDNLRTYNGFTWDFEALARELYRVTKPGGVAVWVVNDATIDGSESLTSFKHAIFFRESCGFNLHDTMIYTSNKPPRKSNRYEQAFEYMFVFSKGKPSTVNLLHEPCKKAGYTRKNITFRSGGDKLDTKQYTDVVAPDKIRGNIWTFACGNGGSTSDKEAFAHPAIVPEKLARDHILSWSNPGDTVLDPFLGSGTTGKMAITNDRDFIGIEISAEYLTIAKNRIEEAEFQKAVDAASRMG